MRWASRSAWIRRRGPRNDRSGNDGATSCGGTGLAPPRPIRTVGIAAEAVRACQPSAKYDRYWSVPLSTSLMNVTRPVMYVRWSS